MEFVPMDYTENKIVTLNANGVQISAMNPKRAWGRVGGIWESISILEAGKMCEFSITKGDTTTSIVTVNCIENDGHISSEGTIGNYAVNPEIWSKIPYATNPNCFNDPDVNEGKMQEIIIETQDIVDSALLIL